MIGNKKILCVVTARKGSKGISGKNYKELLGKPLFMWSVLAGLRSKYVDRTVVSSNCEEVRKALHKFAEPMIDKRVKKHMQKKAYSEMIPFFVERPDEISGDLSKNEDALIHVLDFFKDRGESGYDIVINLQPTSPVRLDNLLDRAIEAYHDGGYDSLLTAAKDTPFLWQKINGEWRYPVDKNDCCNRKMRQEFEEDDFVFHDNGNIYITDAGVLLDTECRIGDKPCVFGIDDFNSLQIDTEFDFKLIETMLKMKGIDSPIGGSNG